MSLDEMYELAIKAGCSCKWGIYSFTEAELKKFVQFLIAAEREACALIAWNHEPDESGPIETAIRARGEK